MVVLCDGCGDDISRLSRAEAHIPLSDDGGVDLCPECEDVLTDLFASDDAEEAADE